MQDHISLLKIYYSVSSAIISISNGCYEHFNTHQHRFNEAVRSQCGLRLFHKYLQDVANCHKYNYISVTKGFKDLIKRMSTRCVFCFSNLTSNSLFKLM